MESLSVNEFKKLQPPICSLPEFQEFLFVKENVFKLNYEYTNHTLNGMAIETPGTQMANLKG
jgi:hypothetical protein